MPFYEHFSTFNNAFRHILPKQMLQNKRRIAWRVACQEKEARIVRQKPAAILQKFDKAVVDFEKFLVGSASETRRVQNDAVVFSAAPQFPLQELVDIIDNPPYRRVLQAVYLRISMRPVDAFL